jgi:hypothetical protein
VGIQELLESYRRNVAAEFHDSVFAFDSLFYEDFLIQEYKKHGNYDLFITILTFIVINITEVHWYVQ